MLRLEWLTGLFARRAERRRRAERQTTGWAGESLEGRVLLSAAFATVPADVGPHAPEADHAGPAKELKLRIVGTEVRYDEVTGLPSYMAGKVYYCDGAKDGQFAGTYEEHLSPILHPEYGFVGTVGVSTFKFQNESGKTTFGEVTTTNYSYITGVENGAVQVSSGGQITGGTRRLDDVVGGLFSSSSVVLGPTFSLECNLTLHFRKEPQAAELFHASSDTAGSQKTHQSSPAGGPHSAWTPLDHVIDGVSDDLLLPPGRKKA